MNCSGTRYFYSPNIFALNEAARQKKTSLAFVGTPCQIQAVRKAQKAGLKLVSPVKYLIGLMRSECFTYEGLMEKHLHRVLGLNLNSIRKMNIKGKMLITTDSGLYTIPLADIKQYARESCRRCSDFSSELADVSAGGLGMNRWTFVVIRTERGAELFDGAERVGVIKTRDVKEEPNAMNLLCSLSRKKKRGLIR
jgi:coenzyme F420 hydrogenase subunit beta